MVCVISVNAGKQISPKPRTSLVSRDHTGLVVVMSVSKRCPLFVVMSVLERCPLFVVMSVSQRCPLFAVMFVLERCPLL